MKKLWPKWLRGLLKQPPLYCKRLHPKLWKILICLASSRHKLCLSAPGSILQRGHKNFRDPRLSVWNILKKNFQKDVIPYLWIWGDLELESTKGSCQKWKVLKFWTPPNLLGLGQKFHYFYFWKLPNLLRILFPPQY